MPHELPAFIPRTDALDDLLPLVPRATHPPGADVMLRLIAYDIADPKRWRRVSDTCADYGVRVQLSLFECWLDDEAFEAFWIKLQAVVDAQEDRLVAYTLDAAAARRRQTVGDTMRCTEKVNCYLL